MFKPQFALQRLCPWHTLLFP